MRGRGCGWRQNGEPCPHRGTKSTVDTTRKSPIICTGYQTLQIQVEYTDGEFITSESRFNVYGVGETWAESLADFTSMLVDLFEELSASQDVLSPHLGEQLESLRAILSPC